MSIRAVLFDWTGTLAYQDRHHRVDPIGALAPELAAMPLPVAPASLRQAVRELIDTHGDSLALDDLLARAIHRTGQDAAPGQVQRLSRAFARAMMAGQELYDDARGMLASLKYRGYRTAIVSNLIVPASEVYAHLARQGAGGYLDVIITSGDIGQAKPHPLPFLAALDALAIQPADALVVGDSPRTDIAGAIAAGIAAVLIDRHGRGEPAPVPRIARLTALNSLLGEGPAAIPES